jgi:transcriptional regulator with XRE-family HTH domain
MEGWKMYSRIQALKEKGFSQRQVSRMVRVSRNTISKYWAMDPFTYSATYQMVNRMTVLMAYEPVVVKWLETYPSMTAAQVRDWLEENYQLDAADRTVRRFVAKLREQKGITKITEPRRDYEAVEELPIGYQLQLDFGTKTVRDAYSGRYIRLYLVVFTLSYSRYKWGVFQDRPFLSADLVSALYSCFEYFGGMPRQLVYDQDSIIVVSENSGDIVHTQAFAAFLAESRLEVRVCRKSDPESKGVIEASVKFVKGNFMENRLYMGLGIWNQSFEGWLDRTGNGQKHGTTKRKPSDMFAEEQEYLLPLYGVAPAVIAEEMDRNVRKDNTVLYKSNRYSVPFGTYSKVKKVFLAVEDGKLQIMDQIGELIATHDICEEKGKLIRPESHRRNKSERIKELLDKAVSLLGGEFREYLETICERKPRYVRDQLDLTISACEAYGRETLLAAMAYCQELELYSANDLRDAAEAMGVQQLPNQPSRLPVEDERYHIPVQKRDLSIYADAAAAGSGVAQ